MLRYILPLLLSASYGSSLRSNVDLFLKDSKPSLSQLKEKLSESVPILGRFNDTRVSCDACLIIKSSSSSVSGIFPWLFNNAKVCLRNSDEFRFIKKAWGFSLELIMIKFQWRSVRFLFLSDVSVKKTFLHFFYCIYSKKII